MSGVELEEEIVIGKRGEIRPKKAIRNFFGLNPGDRVLIKATPTEIRIQKILSIDEIFKLPIISSGTPDELEEEINEESKKIEENIK